MALIKVNLDDIARTIMANKDHKYTLRFNTGKKPAAESPCEEHRITIMHSQGLSIMYIKPDAVRADGMLFEITESTTQDEVCKYLQKYAEKYNLPAFMVTSSFLVNENQPDNTPVCLNETLLDLILFIQRARSYYISRAAIQGSPADWYPEVKRDYDDTPGSVFEKAGIAKNKHNFEEMLRFPVTDEMWRCQAEDLGQFKTAFWR